MLWKKLFAIPNSVVGEARAMAAGWLKGCQIKPDSIVNEKELQDPVLPQICEGLTPWPSWLFLIFCGSIQRYKFHVNLYLHLASRKIFCSTF